jgi:hypothetical protein
MRTQNRRRLGEREGLGQAVIEQVAEAAGERGVAMDRRGRSQVGHDALAQGDQPRFGRHPVACAKRFVHAHHCRQRPRVAQCRRTRDCVDGGTRQPRLLEVDDPLVERLVAVGRAPVVGDVGWQQRDRLGRRETLRAVEAVRHGAFVDDQQRPVVVGVRGVGVLVEGRVQHLANMGHLRVPRSHRLGHARNVQDGTESGLGD